jgi:hypothetical protein
MGRDYPADRRGRFLHIIQPSADCLGNQLTTRVHRTRGMPRGVVAFDPLRLLRLSGGVVTTTFGSTPDLSLCADEVVGRDDTIHFSRIA